MVTILQLFLHFVILFLYLNLSAQLDSLENITNASVEGDFNVSLVSLDNCDSGLCEDSNLGDFVNSIAPGGLEDFFIDNRTVSSVNGSDFRATEELFEFSDYLNGSQMIDTEVTVSVIATNATDDPKSSVWPIKHAAIVKGDVVLGGLMMVHEREDSITCGPIMPQGGIQALEAMLFTLDHINSIDLLPNITLGAHILDDCDKDTYGLEMALDFIKGNTQHSIFLSLFSGVTSRGILSLILYDCVHLNHLNSSRLTL